MSVHNRDEAKQTVSAAWKNHQNLSFSLDSVVGSRILKNSCITKIFVHHFCGCNSCNFPSFSSYLYVYYIAYSHRPYIPVSLNFRAGLEIAQLKKIWKSKTVLPLPVLVLVTSIGITNGCRQIRSYLPTSRRLKFSVNRFSVYIQERRRRNFQEL